jgi:hypothetical protein
MISFRQNVLKKEEREGKECRIWQEAKVEKGTMEEWYPKCNRLWKYRYRNSPLLVRVFSFSQKEYSLVGSRECDP